MKGFLLVLLGAVLALVAVGVLGSGEEGKAEAASLTAGGAADQAGPLDEGVCFPILADDDEGRANAKQDIEIWDQDGDCELGPDEYPDRTAFAAADRDGSGTISLNEHQFLTILEFIDSNADDLISVGELAVVAPDMAAMFVSLADADLDGRISYVEFDLFAGDGKAPKTEGDDFAGALRLEDAAFTADTDGDGFLAPAEVPYWNRVAHLDSDGDGLLTRREYRGRWLDLVAAEHLERFRAADKDGDGRVTTAEWPNPGGEFHLIDANRDHAVTEDEVLGFMERFLGALGELPERGMFIMLDADRSGDLSYQEMPPGEAQDGFVFLDLDLSGLVTWEEAEPILILFARTEALREGRLAPHFAAMDSDGDGMLGMEELGLEEEVFHALDQDNDGSVSEEELAKHKPVSEMS
ncbi:hypothetical protein IIA16_01515 [bacterium]|nr:hypothetical protein [bacterium]